MYLIIRWDCTYVTRGKWQKTGPGWLFGRTHEETNNRKYSESENDRPVFSCRAADGQMAKDYPELLL